MNRTFTLIVKNSWILKDWYKYKFEKLSEWGLFLFTMFSTLLSGFLVYKLYWLCKMIIILL